MCLLNLSAETFSYALHWLWAKVVELRNGETYNGHWVNCDTWIHIHLHEVICASKVIDKVQEETKNRSDRRPPGVGCGRGRDDNAGRPLKGIGRGLEDGGSKGGGQGRGVVGGKSSGNRGGGGSWRPWTWTWAILRRKALQFEMHRMCMKAWKAVLWDVIRVCRVIVFETLFVEYASTF